MAARRVDEIRLDAHRAESTQAFERACELAIDVFWHGKGTVVEASVPAGGVAQVELALGPPRAKTVHGVVRDGAGRPVEGASVVAAVEDGEPVLAITDGAGRYSLRTVSGATIIVTSPSGLM